MATMAGGEYTSVRDFYKDRSIFITGGTGFMGKVLVEKLLRSCPDIKNIYLLMRPKKGQDVQQRLQELLNAPVIISLFLLAKNFEYCKKICETFKRKCEIFHCFRRDSCLRSCGETLLPSLPRSYRWPATSQSRNWASRRPIRTC